MTLTNVDAFRNFWHEPTLGLILLRK